MHPLPCADLTDWGDDPDETCPYCNASRREACKLEDENYEPPDPPGFEGGFADNH
jgi:hypothetical protein